MNRYSILIVDEDEESLSLFRSAPKAFPCLMLEARSLEEGLKKIEEAPVDIVICNLELPQSNGIEFLRRVKQSHSSILRILSSKAAEVSDLVDAVNTGEIYRYLIKPLKPEEVPLIISECCRYCSKINTKRKLMQMLSEQNLYLERLKNQLETKVFTSGKALTSSQWILKNLPYYIVAWDRNLKIIYQNKTQTLYFDLLILLKSIQDSEGKIVSEKSSLVLGGWNIRFSEYADQAIRYIAVLQREDVLYE